MALYSYVARNEKGLIVRGTLDAPGAQAAHAALRDMNLQSQELVQTFAGDADEASSPSDAKPDGYAPLVDTLRLYAGWLLAWYFAVFALGSYQFTRSLPVRISFIEELFLSPMMLGFACLCFLFLVLSRIHQATGKGVLKGIGLTVVGFVLFAVFFANM